MLWSAFLKISKPFFGDWASSAVQVGNPEPRLAPIVLPARTSLLQRHSLTLYHIYGGQLGTLMSFWTDAFRLFLNHELDQIQEEQIIRAG